MASASTVRLRHRHAFLFRVSDVESAVWEVIAHPSDFLLIYKVRLHGYIFTAGPSALLLIRPRCAQLAFIVTYLYGGANLFVKSSFLALYHRLDSRKPMRWAVYFLFFVEIGQFVSSCVVLGLSWMPPEHLLDGKANPVVGLSATQKFYNANGIISSVTSAAIYITPMFMLRGLAIPRVRSEMRVTLSGIGLIRASNRDKSTPSQPCSVWASYQQQVHTQSLIRASLTLANTSSQQLASRHTTPGTSSSKSISTTKSPTASSGSKSKSTPPSSAAPHRLFAPFFAASAPIAAGVPPPLTAKGTIRHSMARRYRYRTRTQTPATNGRSTARGKNGNYRRPTSCQTQCGCRRKSDQRVREWWT